MFKNTKVLIFGLLGLIILLLIAIISGFSGLKKPQPSPTQSPLKVIVPPSLKPAQIPSPSPSLIPVQKLTKQQLISLTPIQEKLFNIEYYSIDGSFRITVKENPYQTNKALAQKWLKDRGLNPDDLNIDYAAYSDVK